MQECHDQNESKVNDVCKFNFQAIDLFKSCPCNTLKFCAKVILKLSLCYSFSVEVFPDLVIPVTDPVISIFISICRQEKSNSYSNTTYLTV